MALAAKSPVEERVALLRAMARSWLMLASQMERFEATKIEIKIKDVPRRR